MGAFHEGGVKKPFQCTHCDKAFPSASKLKRHISVVHLGLKPFECHRCSAKFSERSRLTAHLAGKDSFKCGVQKEADNELDGE